jgi:osmoprotectant transport system permease protein
LKGLPTGRPDTLALTGTVIGLLSLWPDWLVLSANRLTSGNGFHLWDSLGAAGWLIAALWLACLSLLVWVRGRNQAIALGLCACLLVAGGFGLAGLSARELLAGQPTLARISFGPGLILNLAGSAFLIFWARRALVNQTAWRETVSWLGWAALAGLLAGGVLNSFSVIQEFTGREERFLAELGHHLYLVGVSVGIGCLLGIPLGIWATRNRMVERPVFYLASMAQTVPSLALFGLLIAPLSALSFSFPALREAGIRGVGDTPAVIALVIYSLLPIIRNTYLGLRRIDPSILDAGRGMGMNRWQVFRRLELPLAAPLSLEGVRTAAVQTVGLATVAALIGAGGLGWFIFQGMGQAANDLILLGAIPVILLAVALDGLLRLAVAAATPHGQLGVTS